MTKVLDSLIMTEYYLFTRGAEALRVPLDSRMQLQERAGELWISDQRLWKARDILRLQEKGFDPDPNAMRYLDCPAEASLSAIKGVHYPLGTPYAPNAAITAINALLERITLSALDLIVDFGTFDGRKFQHILERVSHKRAIGIDQAVPRESLEGIEFILHNLDDSSPMSDSSADMCCAIDFVSAMANSFSAINYLVNALKPNGYLFFVDRNVHSEYFARHAQRLGIEVLQNLQVPVKIEGEIELPSQQTIDIIIETAQKMQPTLTTEQIRDIRMQFEEQHHRILYVAPYVINYHCVLARKI